MSANPYVTIKMQPDKTYTRPDSRSLVRCYKTGSSKVESICHHSGRFLSKEAEVTPAFYQDSSLEFVPMLLGKEAEGAHSKGFQHFMPFSPLKILIVPGTILLLWGVIWLSTAISYISQVQLFDRLLYLLRSSSSSEMMIFASPLITAFWVKTIIPIVLVVVGLYLTVIGINKARIFRFASMKQSKSLGYIPLNGKFYTIVITEDIDIKMELSPDRDVYIQEHNGKGEISLKAYLTGKEIEASRKSFHNKAKQYGFDKINKFRLGWIAVDRSPYINPNLGQTALCMEQDIPPLKNQDGARWYEAVSHTYQILAEGIQPVPDKYQVEIDTPREMYRSPIWIRPVLENLSGGHTLRIEFDIPDEFIHLHNWQSQEENSYASGVEFVQALARAKLKWLNIQVDQNSFSDFDFAEFPVLHSRGRVSANRDKVQWQNLPISHLLDEKYQQHPEYPLKVTFSRPVTDIKGPIKITFSLVVEASVSGIRFNPSHFWLPNGRSITTTQRGLTVKPTTNLTGSLLIQPNIFAFPLEKTSTKVISSGLGVPITSKVITEIIKELEDKYQIYIKSASKSPSTLEVEDGKPYQKRIWNIVGRYYTENRQPVDVHLMLLSQSFLNDVADTTIWGNVTCRILQMSYNINMEKKIKDKAENIEANISKILKSKRDTSEQYQPVTRILG